MVERDTDIGKCMSKVGFIMVFDFKKEYKEFYMPKNKPEIVTVPKANYNAFEDLGCTALWCGYYDGNIKSKRVQKKCGFIYHHTEENKPCLLMGDVRTEHFTYLTKEQWKKWRDDFGLA